MGGDRLAQFSPGACDTPMHCSRLELRAPRPPPRAARGRRRLDDVRAAGAARAGGARLHRRAVRRARPPRSRRSRVRHHPLQQQHKAIDVSGISGVFGGWTAADFVAPAVTATLAQDLYGPSHKLVSHRSRSGGRDESSLTGTACHLQPHAPHAARRRDGPPRRDVRLPSVVAYVPKVELASPSAPTSSATAGPAGRRFLPRVQHRRRHPAGAARAAAPPRRGTGAAASATRAALRSTFTYPRQSHKTP